MQLYGALDLGTNSIRLLIAHLQNEKLNTVYTGLRTVRLGEGLVRSGLISEAARERAFQGLGDFIKVIKSYPQLKIGAVATSAIREASNGPDFLEEIKAKTGIDVQLISGEEEACLSYNGAIRAVDDVKNPMVIDIGGGSTEVIFNNCGKLEFYSQPVGAVKCTENASTPQEILELLEDTMNKAKESNVKQMVGVGGTITTLAAINQNLKAYDPRLIQGYTLKVEDVSRLLFELAGMSIAERKKIPGLQPERADIIVSGTKILWVLMNYMDKSSITVSEADLLHGIIMDLAGH